MARQSESFDNHSGALESFAVDIDRRRPTSAIVAFFTAIVLIGVVILMWSSSRPPRGPVIVGVSMVVFAAAIVASGSGVFLLRDRMRITINGGRLQLRRLPFSSVRSRRLTLESIEQFYTEPNQGHDRITWRIVARLQNGEWSTIVDRLSDRDRARALESQLEELLDLRPEQGATPGGERSEVFEAVAHTELSTPANVNVQDEPPVHRMIIRASWVERTLWVAALIALIATAAIANRYTAAANPTVSPATWFFTIAICIGAFAKVCDSFWRRIVVEVHPEYVCARERRLISSLAFGRNAWAERLERRKITAVDCRATLSLGRRSSPRAIRRYGTHLVNPHGDLLPLVSGFRRRSTALFVSQRLARWLAVPLTPTAAVASPETV